MGRGAASSVGMDDAPVTIDQSVDGLTKAVWRSLALKEHDSLTYT
jgi:hypothetical protein